MKHVIRLAAVMSVAALALAIPAHSAFAAAPPDSSSTIPKLLNQVKQHASEANHDAQLMESYRRSNVDFKTYAQALTNIKEHANDLFQDFYALQRVRESGTPAQREAIDNLEPLLREMATSLTNTIQTLNTQKSEVNMPEFRKRVHADSMKIEAVYRHLCECTSKNSKI